MTKHPEQQTADLPAPPLRPDPEIMDNIEGNADDLTKDQESARRYLVELDRS